MFVIISLLLSFSVTEKNEINCINTTNLSCFVKEKNFVLKKEDQITFEKIPTKLIKIN